MKKLIVFIIVIISTLIITSIVYFSVSTYFNLPIVQKSHLTKECVGVLPVGECGKLPKKYLVEWVE